MTTIILIMFSEIVVKNLKGSSMWNKEREAIISVMKEDAKWVIEPAKNFKGELREVIQVVRTNPTAIVAGGCFADIFRGLSFKDLDCWYRTPNDWDSVVSKLKEIKYWSPNCLATNKDGVLMEHIGLRFGTPIFILENFDFTVCKFAVYFEKGEVMVMYHRDFFRDLQRMNLVIDTERTLLGNSVGRIIKYANKGFKITKKVGSTLINLSRRHDASIDDQEWYSE